MTALASPFGAALALTAAVGVSLGMLGGGGSILATPILIYVAGIAPRQAIPMSLAIVGATSLLAGFLHRRDGQVDPVAAALFAPTAMAGAFAGATLTHRVSERALLLLFAALMLGVGALLWRRGRRAAPPGRAVGPRRVGATLAAGLAVGTLTGFLGVGGGFLVVPALVLFGGLPMRRAIGTSLWIIAASAAAGLAAHWGASPFPVGPAVALAAAAMAGAVVGQRWAGRVSQATLQRGFAAAIVTVGAAIGWHTLSRTPTLLQGATMHPYLLALLGGVLIGLAASALLWLNGRIAGVSGIVAGACVADRVELPWRLAFVGGLIAGGLLVGLASPGAFGALAGAPASPLAIGAGLLVGVGTRLGGGCTSGHGVCGIARGAPRSLVATVTFMATGVATVFALRTMGGLS